MAPKRSSTSAALDLSELARLGMSGEFICASSAVEVHVHLQSGRVAWATDSRHAFVFTRYLQEHAALSKTVFREVLDECRRDHLPLGETLVAWELVSVEQVREALRHQISFALLELATLRSGQHVFLGRAKAYQHYASELTFALSDFTAELEVGADCPSVIPTHSLVRQIREAVSDVSWIEVLDGEHVAEQDPPAVHSKVPIPVLKLTLLDGSELVTLRSARGTLVGVSLRGERTLWCRVAVDSTFGSAVSALSAVGGFALPAPPTPRQGYAPGRLWTVGNGDSSAVRELADFIGRAPDLVAAVVSTPSGTELVQAVGEPAIRPEWCFEVVRRRSPVFASARDVFGRSTEEPAPDLLTLGFRYLSLATAESDFWCFGAELAVPHAVSAWIFVRRHAGQGLGWAYLSALTRRLEALPDWAARAG